MNWKKVLTKYKGVVLFIGLIVFLNLYCKIFESNKFINYQIKQAAITGHMSVRNSAGLYLKLWGNITTYPKSEDLNFQDFQTEVRFNDGSVAKVVGTVKFRLPTNEADQLALHRDFANYANVETDLILKNMKEALSQTATLMMAEESYSTRRGEFAAVAEQQARQGIFETKSREVDAVDPSSGTKFRKKIIELALDNEGNPVVRKSSLLNKYNVEILQFVINDFIYDERINSLIAKKKEAEQEKVVAAAKAEKAKQEAETIKQEGIAKVATAEAEALALKKTAVVAAEKEAEVARLNAEKAKQEAIAIKAKGTAEAEAARLKVSAGLTPLEKATIEKETRIGIAAALANWQGPKVVLTGNSNGHGNPMMDSLAIKAMMEIADKLDK